MTNLMQASYQWRTRPDDERFLTVQELHDSVNARRLRSASRDTRLDQLVVKYDEQGNLGLANGADAPLHQFSNWSFGQLATQVGAPAGYLRNLPAPLAKINLEYGLEMGDHHTNVSKVYTHKPADGSIPSVRAFTSATYGRIYDSQITGAVLRLIERNPQWTVPLQAYGGVNSTLATTLYASDRDVWMFLVDETRPIGSNGDTLYRGFIVWNSEVGKSVFGLMTFLYNRVCQNRIIWGAKNVEELRIRHSSMAPDRFLLQAAPALDAISQASAEPVIAAIKKAKATQVARDVAGVEAWLKGKGFNAAESKIAINLAAQGGNTGSSGDPTSLWNIVQGGTAAARSINHTDTRVDLERKWSALLAAM